MKASSAILSGGKNDVSVGVPPLLDGTDKMQATTTDLNLIKEWYRFGHKRQ